MTLASPRGAFAPKNGRPFILKLIVNDKEWANKIFLFSDKRYRKALPKSYVQIVQF